MYLGISALLYLVLLFSPLALFQTVNAQADSETPATENYGKGTSSSLLSSTSSCLPIPIFLLYLPLHRLFPFRSNSTDAR
jgi:heat shock protein 5